MPREAELIVKGYREFLRATDHAGREAKAAVRGTFRNVGEIVRRSAEGKFARYSPRSAAGYRTVVRVRGVAVEQSLRKTTGKRPDWGAVQMKDALLPALEQNERRVEKAFEAALERVADHFENR